MNINYVKTLLSKDIIQLELEINYLKNQIIHYERTIDDLENSRISKRAQRLLRESYRLDVTKYNVLERLSIIKTDLAVLNEKFRIVEKRYKESVKIVNCLKYHQLISFSQMESIQKRLIQENVADVDIIKIVEYIKIRNVNLQKEKNPSLSSDDLYLILNMLSQGYEEIKIPTNDNSKNLDLVIGNTVELIDTNGVNVANSAMNLESIYKKEDLTYIYSMLLKHYQDEMIELVAVLKEKDYYFNISLLQEIKTDYKYIYQKYMFIRDKFDSLTPVKDENILIENIDLMCEVNNMKKYLYYSTNNLEDAHKCYFIKDLIGLREESYKAILSLLDSFKKGDMHRLKYLSGTPGFIELKDDQIRIVMKPLGNNNYSVMGVFIKKSNNDMETYQKMCNRPCAIIDEAYSNKVEEIYHSYIKANARKGSR